MFAAYELSKQNADLKICLIEMGKLVSQRQKHEVMSGMGGAGTFSDGKLHFTPVLSHEKMLHLYSEEEYQKELDYVDQIYTEFGVDAEYFPKDDGKTRDLVDEAKRNGIKLFIRKVRHVGSDKLPEVIAKFENYLKRKNVNIMTEIEVVDFVVENQTIQGVVLKDNEKIFSDYVICAPGRVKAKWMQDLAGKYNLDYAFDKVEVGVRVEFAEGIMRRHSDVMYEAVFAMRTPTFDDTIRTFCPCPRGHVAIERYDSFICVNGHSNSSHNSENSNFAFVSEVLLTEPIENTISYAKSMAQVATLLGGGKPIIQRLADLRKGRRSTWTRIKKSFVEPTLKDVMPGDISMALSHRIVTNIIEGLQQLDKVMPGIASGDTLLYAPEIKLRSSKMNTDKTLQTSNMKNLYVAGDASGLSGNIVGAAATGIICARGILNKKNEQVKNNNEIKVEDVEFDQSTVKEKKINNNQQINCY